MGKEILCLFIICFRLCMVALLLSCAATTQTDILNSQYKAGIGPSEKIHLPQPFATPSVSNSSKVIGWPKGRMPTPAPGFEVSLFAEDFDNPRLAYVMPNEDITRSRGG